MSLLLKSLLLATLAAIITVSSSQSSGQTPLYILLHTLHLNHLLLARLSWRILPTDGGAQRKRRERWGEGRRGREWEARVGGKFWSLGAGWEERNARKPRSSRASRTTGGRGLPGGGTTYIRWGRTTCPTNHGTELVYSGRAGATRYDHKGGAANYLCMSDNPDHSLFQVGVQTERNYIAGVEYYYDSLLPLSSSNNHNAPCALCYMPNRCVSVMIPAKTVCPANWTLEYVGYLMSNYYDYDGRTEYVCVDANPESVLGLNLGSDPRAYFTLVEPYCNGFPCPPYVVGRELTCVVCTR